MTLFILIAALMAAVALCFIVPPLLGRATPASKQRAPHQTQAALAVLREQLAELQADQAANKITPADYARARTELEQRALHEGRAAHDAADTRPARRWAMALALLLPLTAAALYGILGASKAIETGNTDAHSLTAAASEHEAPERMAALLTQLTRRLQDHPDDPAGWTMLANTYLTLGDFSGGAAAWRQIGANAPNDPQVLADWADILATAANGDFSGEPDRLIARVLAQDPNHMKGLALAGTRAFFRHEFEAAAQYWERILPQLAPDDPAYLQIHNSLNAARQKTGPAAPPAPAQTPETAPPATAHALTLRGRVEIDPALPSRPGPDKPVFLFMRPAQGGPPIAALRLFASALPAPFDFANATRMQSGPLPGLVTIGARLSMTGDPTAQSGDLESRVITVMPDATGIVLRIDRIRQ